MRDLLRRRNADAAPATVIELRVRDMPLHCYRCGKVRYPNSLAIRSTARKPAKIAVTYHQAGKLVWDVIVTVAITLLLLASYGFDIGSS